MSNTYSCAVQKNKYNFFLFLSLAFQMAFGQAEIFEFEHGGFNRQYYLYLPDSICHDDPLVFVFHGFGSSASTIMNYSEMNNIASENNFAVCYPQGTTDNNGNSFFNVGYDFHQNEVVNDVDFIVELAYHLQSEYNLSPINTFATGMSNGGELCYLMACQNSNVFRSIAPVSGTMMNWFIDTCLPQKPTSVLEIHGTNDQVTWWDGDIDNTGGWGAYAGVDEIIQFWSDINLCMSFELDTLPNISSIDGSYIISEKNIDCMNNNEVWLYRIINGGHDWPGSSGNMDINSSSTIWEFFKKFLIEYRIGDVDFNNKVNIYDILLISDHIINNSNYIEYLMDLNSDRIVDFNDISSILIFILNYQTY